jgi:hypothetical protein
MPVQYRASWSIPNAGPSVSTFHFLGDVVNEPVALAAAVRAFFAGLVATIPNDVTVSFAPEFTIHDVATGTLIGTAPVTPPAAVVGTATGSWAAGAGVRIDWLTAYIRNGRRVRGRTFIVPAGGGSYGTDGRVLPALITSGNAAADTFRDAALAAGNPFAVWSRPTASLPGAIFPVTDGATSGLVATLRGRKY